jgi:hypothetical protein
VSLVAKFRGKPQTRDGGAAFMGPETGPSRAPAGIVIDGAVYPLDGQPPVAASHGWGDMGWLWSPFYRLRGMSGGR